MWILVNATDKWWMVHDKLLLFFFWCTLHNWGLFHNPIEESPQTNQDSMEWEILNTAHVMVWQLQWEWQIPRILDGWRKTRIDWVLILLVYSWCLYWWHMVLWQHKSALLIFKIQGNRVCSRTIRIWFLALMGNSHLHLIYDIYILLWINEA